LHSAATFFRNSGQITQRQALQLPSHRSHLKMNRSHLIAGEQALILPCLGRTEIDMQAAGEQFVSTWKIQWAVQSSRECFARISPSAQRTGNCGRFGTSDSGKSTVDWENLVADYDRFAIERVIPGFEDYNVRVRKGGGFYYLTWLRREISDATGKAISRFTPFLITNRTRAVCDDDQEPRSTQHHDLRSQDRYRGIHNERRRCAAQPEDMLCKLLKAK